MTSNEDRAAEIRRKNHEEAEKRLRPVEEEIAEKEKELDKNRSKKTK